MPRDYTSLAALIAQAQTTLELLRARATMPVWASLRLHRIEGSIREVVERLQGPYAETAPETVEVTDAGREAMDRDRAAREVEPETTQMLISLISEAVPSIDLIRSWSPASLRAVDEYCAAVHVHASDNDDVFVPPMPNVLATALDIARAEHSAAANAATITGRID